ncbi:MAG TPA: hypothetical protein PLH29_04520 [bacterium]|nr:hypothetical protein [bacterium]
MKFIVKKNELKSTAAHTVQRAGYKFIIDRNTGKESFVKILNSTGYPRFHLYLEENGDNIILNLHLDQKKPIYQGQKAHSGEYDSAIVNEEADRLKSLFVG